MSPIGRIFVVINLVLAAVFLGSGAAFLASGERYRTDFEKEIVAKAKMKEDLDSQIGELEAQKSAAERMREEMRNAKAQLETQKEALDADIAAKTDELNQLKAQVANWGSQVEGLSGQIETAVANAEAASEARVAAVDARNEAQNEAADAVRARAAAEDQINQLEAEIASLRTDLTATRGQLQSTETQLATAMQVAGLTIDDIGAAAPPINGAVLGVDAVGGATIVHINRGSNDNVKQGYVFEIYSSGTYKGQARVEIVHGGSCSARMITAREGTAVAQGDRASTQIGG